MNAKPNKTLLLVEDDPVIAQLESRLLGKKGYQIKHVDNGSEAIKIAIEKTFFIDLILMDIDLGDKVDGTEAAVEILKRVDIPIVFLSSHTDPKIVERTEKITSYGYVVKDSGITVLDTSIKMAFKLFEANRLTRKKEQLLRSITENYPNSYFSIIEADFTIGYTSGQEFQKLNLDPNQFVGLGLEQVFGEKSEFVKKHYKKAFQGEKVSFELFINEQYQKYQAVPIYSETGSVEQILAIVENITEHKQAEKKLRRQLLEKENLLKEVHHRVRNNIAAIGHFLMLESKNLQNPELRLILQDSITRVHNMRVLYEKLLLTDGYKEISVKSYLESLMDIIVKTYKTEKDIKLETEIENFLLDVKILFPIGVIINELLTNIIKYAFVDRKSGLVHVILKKEENYITLVVQDNGIGLPDGFDLESSKGFGMMLIKMFSEQLDGKLNFKNQNGLRVSLKIYFPILL